jgi:hypothetical protein
VTLTITPTNTVWICMANGAGKVLIPGVEYTAGQTIPSYTAGKLLLILGNSHVTLKTGYGPIKVTPSSLPTDLEIGPTAARTMSPASAPTCS